MYKEKAISTLKQSLTPLGIQVILEKEELSIIDFKKNPLQSNQIWLNGQLIEDWIGGKVSHSPCCSICGSTKCRTVIIGEGVYETIPAELIIKAGFLAASHLIGREIIGRETNILCCESENTKSFITNCCPR